ncbi:MAG TPA: endonuclease/exonuclease/phosphatase family protein [Thermoanaerobaculia bacterium]|nr:endonuclease/exonuclease/phosphatase family protein [Thermoanaerobaculia bacterium]
MIAVRLLAVLLLAGCATSATPPPLAVMTYNIRLHLASDGPNAWPHRKDAVAAIAAEADLVGVQEALPEQLADLDAALPRFARFGTGRSAERSGEHTAVYFRTSRLELLDHDTFWLSETPSVAGSKGWDAAYERIATWGKMRDRRSGRTFYLFNTHFDHVGAEARRESARLLVSRIDRIAGDAAVLVTGDFNDVAGSEFFEIMTAAGLGDAHSLSRTPPLGPDSTWNAFRVVEPGRRIDFIFVRGPTEILSHATSPATLDDGRFPSDHLPVLAEVRVGSD